MEAGESNDYNGKQDTTIEQFNALESSDEEEEIIPAESKISKTLSD